MSRARDIADLSSVSARLDTVGGSEGALSNRNLIVNGAMQVSQRGTSFSPPSSGAYVVDRFHQYQGGGGVLYYEQSTDAPAGFKNSLKITVNTADSSIASGDFYYMRYEAEGSDCSRLSLGTSDAQEFTFSFYVKSSLTGTFSGAFQNSAVNRAYVFEYTINSANTWERKTVTLTGDTSGTWLTNTSVGLRIAFDLGNGSSLRSSAGAWAGAGNYGSTGSVELVGTASATWQITGVQLEVGDTATDFEHRTYADELARCQRYYQQYDYTSTYHVILQPTFNISTGTCRGVFNFPVEMRASPTLSTNGAGNFRINDNVNDETAISVGQVYQTPFGTTLSFDKTTGNLTNAGISYVNSENTNDASLRFDAEL